MHTWPRATGAFERNEAPGINNLNCSLAYAVVGVVIRLAQCRGARWWWRAAPRKKAKQQQVGVTASPHSAAAAAPPAWFDCPWHTASAGSLSLLLSNCQLTVQQLSTSNHKQHTGAHCAPILPYNHLPSHSQRIPAAACAAACNSYKVPNMLVCTHQDPKATHSKQAWCTLTQQC